MKKLMFLFYLLFCISKLNAQAPAEYTLISDFDSVIVDNIFPVGGMVGQSMIIDNPYVDENCSALKVYKFVASAGTWKMVGFENKNESEIEPISLLDAEYIQFRLRGDDLTHTGIRLNKGDGFTEKVITDLVAGEWNTVIVNFPAQYLDITNLIIIPNQKTNGVEGREYFIADIAYKNRPGTGGDDVISIELNRKQMSLMVGDEFLLEAIVRPTSAIDKSIEWISGNSELVEVDSLGKITVVGHGSTFVLARSAHNHEVTDTCFFEIAAPSDFVVLTDFENFFVNEVYAPSGSGQITDNPYKNINCSANKVYEYTRGSGTWNTWGFLVNPNIDLSTFDYLHMQIRGSDLHTVVSQVQDGAISQEGDWHTNLIPGKWNVVHVKFLKHNSSEAFETFRNINIFINPENTNSAGKKYYITNVVLVRKDGQFIDAGIPGIPDEEPTTATSEYLNSRDYFYPNPAKNKVYVLSKSDFPIEIFNINGLLLKQADSNTEILDIQELAAGVYFIRIDNKTHKLVKLK